METPTSLARSERTALCDTALAVGPDQPTLCGEWTVKELVVHLLVRERSPAAIGIVLSPAAGLTEREMRRKGRQPFEELVARLRKGPSPWSPYALPKLDGLLNTLEFFVHHEDIRRAGAGWEPRELGGDAQKVLWSMVRTAGKGLLRSAPAPVVIENATTGSRTVLKDGPEPVVVSGPPGEVTMFVFGRQPQARVTLSGPDQAVAALQAASFGV
ncbi:TIGR03085 family metal-binding protein [Nocardioides mesophilus]|uniref:TIGR03085 family protein n=1 Tax=Nocardioides mesophilus TaxID=433659 RepID=A0A7G9RBU0_9ACTN|nr:TIGR03085 family metal-binding protein [Nocardioides mesophilus]QNN53065.1 TIGR03085 family protein [Nocardioides mesophilus]